MGRHFPRGRTDAGELAVHRGFVRQFTRSCEPAAKSDLEARSRLTP